MGEKNEKENHGQGHMRQERTHQLSLSFTHTQTCARTPTPAHTPPFTADEKQDRTQKDIFTFFPADICKLLQMFFHKTPLEILL